MRNVISMLIGASALAMIATPASARDKHHDKSIGRGDFQMYVFHRDKLAALYPEKALTARPVTSRDIDAVNIMNDDCTVQAKQQDPGLLKTVAVVAVRNLPGAVAGGYLGSIAGGLVPKGSVVTAVGYAKYNSIATVGGSIGAGINAWEMGKHASVAGCMVGFVPKAQKAGYLNEDVVITYNPFPVYGPTLKRSQFPAPPADESASTASSANTGDTDADGAVPAPPPGTR